MYSPDTTEKEILETKISRLNYLAILITSLWVLFLITILTFSPLSYPILLIVTAFAYIPTIIFILYRVSKLRRRLKAFVIPVIQPMPMVVYDTAPPAPSEGKYPGYYDRAY